MARPSGTGAKKARVKSKVMSSSDESSSAGASDGQVERSSEEESDEELATASKKQKGVPKNGKKRVVDSEDEDDSGEESDEDSQNRKVAPSKSSKGKVNNSRTAKSSTESTKSRTSSNSSKSTLNNGQVQPLQPHNAQPRSPFRTVSLNDASPGASRRRLSNSRVSRADDLCRQSLPSNLRKQTNVDDGDASFASNASSSHDVSVRRGSGGGSGSNNTPSKQGMAQAGLRRTSAGYALHGGGISTLNAAAALKRHASGASTGTSANDFTASLPTLTMEVMNTNYEEWMKMATDNVGQRQSESLGAFPPSRLC